MAKVPRSVEAFKAQPVGIGYIWRKLLKFFMLRASTRGVELSRALV